MPTTSISLRIDNNLLEYLKVRAESEHRTLSNMIVSILDSSHREPPQYSPDDIEECFSKIGAYLAAHANDDEARERYWNYVKLRESCYPIIYPENFDVRERTEGRLNGMSSAEKIIKGLECCFEYETHLSIAGSLVCEECPYNKDDHLGTCTSSMLKDALELLKEQEGKVEVPFSWLVKFCSHIDFKEPMCDSEREQAWREKLKMQFGVNFDGREGTEGR